MNKKGNFRWIIVALLFTATLINYLDREILGILKPDLMKLYDWDDNDYALIVNAFQASYALGQAGFGPILSWLGTKNTFIISIIFWSLAAMGTGMAGSIRGFATARFLLGLGEGGNFPSCIRTVTEWFPQRERSIATGYFNTGSSLGKVVAPLLVPYLFFTIGWRMSFVLLGATGFIWLVFWIMYYETPEKSRFVGSEELAHIQFREAADSGKPGDKVSWFKMLTYRQTWAYVFTGILIGPVWWFYGFWLPDIFNRVFHLNLKQFGLPLAMVAVGAVLGSIGGGALSPFFMKRGLSINAARKFAALLCAISVLPVLLVPSIARAGVIEGAAPAFWAVWVSTLIFALANAAHQGWSATMYTVVSDLFPKNTVGSVVGLGGAISTVSSMAFTWFVGHQLTEKMKAAHGGVVPPGVYDTVLYMCGGAYVLAILIFHVIVPRIQRVQVD